MKLHERVFNLAVACSAGRRPPDITIGDPADPYLLRWYLTPWRRWKHPLWRLLPNLYLHCFQRDDDDRALHDHPSFAISWLLKVGYMEHTIEAGGVHKVQTYRAGSFRFLPLLHAHRIELFKETEFVGGVRIQKPVPCWTLFMFGPRMREWGFHCKNGWIPWFEFTKPDAPGEIGPGCGD